MSNLPRIQLGIPSKQTIEVSDGLDCDSFYITALRTPDISPANTQGQPYNETYHLFTVKEISEAAERYYSDADICIDAQTKAMVGYSHPITYSNRNSILTTRVFVRLDCSKVEEFTDEIVCCLFTPREVRRSKERYDKFVLGRRTIWHRIMKGVKRCLGL